MQGEDLTGRVFGHLTVENFSHRNDRRLSHWHCRCSCEGTAICASNNLKSGNSTSCGCRHGVKISDPIKRSELVQLLDYDPATGLFVWKVSARGQRAGDVAGHYNKANGYVRIGFKRGVSYYAHILAWLFMTGEWPADEIDHKDLDGSNNRWGNLRQATHAQNGWNKKQRSGSGRPYKGVKVLSRGYSAAIIVNGKLIELGRYYTAEEAAKAYDNAARQYHGEFARPNFEYV